MQVHSFKPSSATQTVQDMELSKLSSLERFKSLKEKESLLDSSLRGWGGAHLRIGGQAYMVEEPEADTGQQLEGLS